MPLKKTSFPQNIIILTILYGIVTFVLMGLLTLIYFFIKGSGYTPVIIWNYLILFLTMFFGVKAFQKKNNIIKVTFKETYITGVFIGLIASIGFAFFMIIYTKFIDFEFINNFVSINTLQINKNINAEVLSLQIQRITSVSIGFYAFGQLFLISLFLPLLIFIFFKYKKI
ncbi:MAG: DUF4199 domain-containing protein [Bacteroidales bacterium]